MEHRQLSLTIYRAIWRWARSANGVPFNLRFEDIRTVAPACFEPIGDALCAPSVPLHEADAVREVAHRAFRDSRHLEVCYRQEVFLCIHALSGAVVCSWPLLTYSISTMLSNCGATPGLTLLSRLSLDFYLALAARALCF